MGLPLRLFCFATTAQHAMCRTLMVGRGDGERDEEDYQRHAKGYKKKREGGRGDHKGQGKKEKDENKGGKEMKTRSDKKRKEGAADDQTSRKKKQN